MNTAQPEISTHIVARKRGCLFFVGRGLIVVAIILVILSLLGFAYQTAATQADKQAFPPPGQMVEVNGRQMHIQCTGTGEPTVILEAGAIGFSSHWAWVQQQLELHTRVCAYDRAGHGWSDPAPAPRDGLTIATELQALLNEAGIVPPYVLVGHSLGAVTNRIFAAQYPDQVAGLVLVDSAVPVDLPDEAAFQQWKVENDLLNQPLSFLVRVGVYRLIVNDLARGYPPEQAAQLVAMQSSNQNFDTYYAEVILGQKVLADQGKGAENLGDLPLMVLSADHDERGLRLLQALTAYSSNSLFRVVTGSDHGTILSDERYAAQISTAIVEVIEAARTGQALAA
jgi:pimeloyl-ACP methyl ester carboxylesterase